MPAMVPSRGLQAIRGSAPRLYQQQCRNLSSRTLPRASTLPSPQTSLRTLQWRSRAPAAAFSLSTVRYASTTPTSPAPGPASAAQAPVVEPASSAAVSPPAYNIDTVTLDDVQLAAASDAANNIPEHIGFLKEIGLDYGYGPTAMLEWTLEHMHITFGLPWWGAIAATAILVRAVTFPLYLRSSDQAARQSAMSTVMKPISERMQAAQKAGDQTGVMQAWSEMSAARQRAGLSYGKQFTPMLVQSVLGFCSFKLMRGMANLPVPSLKEGGFGWITDLTVSDGYLLLPAMMAGAMHVMFRYGGETGNNEMMNPGMKSFMLWGMPGIIFVITGWQPGALCIWFVASGGWAMGQAMLMQKPGVRKFFGLTPMYKKAEDQASGSGGGLADQLRSHMESKRGGRTIDATATSKPAGLATMSYQAPKVRTTSARGTPAPAATPASGAPKQSESILSKGKDFWSQVKQKQNEWAEQSRASDVKKRAAAHEARAQKKKDLAKGRR